MTGAPGSTGQAPRGVLIVTGTGTGVGKTVVTAAVAALARERGDRVAVVKPAQTGAAVPPGHARWKGQDIGHADGAAATHGEPADLETVRRLSGVTDLHELARFPDPLSPEAAARVSGLPPLDLADAAAAITALASSRDLVLVEGAGGLLVRYDKTGATLADLAVMLAAPVLVVTAAGLGTLNHTALTLEAIAARGLGLAGVVIGAWPRDPGLADRENLTDLETVAGAPLAGLLPAGSGSLAPAEFRAVAEHGLGRGLGGSFGTGTVYRS